jgi:hypothetical protein
VLGLALGLGACGGSAATGPEDRAPFDFSFDDPRGDTAAVSPLPAGAGHAIDLIKVSGSVSADKVTLILEFAEPIVRWSAGAPNSLDGFVDFDVDHSSATGGGDAAEGQFGLGADRYLDLRDNGMGRMGLVDPIAKKFVTVPFELDGTRLTIEIDRDAFGINDGTFNLGVLIGDRDRPRTDFGPDTGHYTVAPP